MTEQEEQEFRVKLRERWALNKEQEDWYVAKVKEARKANAIRDSIKKAEEETEKLNEIRKVDRDSLNKPFTI
ncbi:MAG: hypothetical protein JSS82_15470 [Bacteroidetes bacterium]|nr:hypothetical protein [Bacteroidota bacterium]